MIFAILLILEITFDVVLWPILGQTDGGGSSGLETIFNQRSVAGGIITFVLAWAVKHIYDLWKNTRSELRVGQEYEDKRERTGYEFVISSLKDQNAKLEQERKERIMELEKRLDTAATKHGECEKANEGYRVLTSKQQEDIEYLKKENTRLSLVEDELREKIYDLERIINTKQDKPQPPIPPA